MKKFSASHKARLGKIIENARQIKQAYSDSVTWAEALRTAWAKDMLSRRTVKYSLDFLRDMLNNHFCKITFLKADDKKPGLLTERIITRDNHFLAEGFQHSGNTNPKHPHLLSFFSLTDDAWRRCKVENILDIEIIPFGQNLKRAA